MTTRPDRRSGIGETYNLLSYMEVVGLELLDGCLMAGTRSVPEGER